MGKYIYYVKVDFAETNEFFDSELTPDVETLEQWCREGKVEKYTIDNFVKAFNDERISDLGYLFYV